MLKDPLQANPAKGAQLLQVCLKVIRWKCVGVLDYMSWQHHTTV